jgi:hypothetical protein
MTEQLFLTYEDFREKVADKRGKTVAMNDINMIQFSAILYDSLLEQYVIKLRLKNEYHKDYSFRDLAICDNTHLIHWGQWLDIAVLVTKHPSLLDAYFFVTGINATFREPCFIEKPFEYRIELLSDKRRSNKKQEFVFFNRVDEKMLCRVDFTVMSAESEVLEHFYKKQS